MTRTKKEILKLTIESGLTGLIDELTRARSALYAGQRILPLRPSWELHDAIIEYNLRHEREHAKKEPTQ